MVMPATRCMPQKHRGSLTLFVEARVFVVLSRKQEPHQPDPPASSHCRLAQGRGIGGGCLCGSLLICRHRLSQAQRDASMSWENTQKGEVEMFASSVSLLAISVFLLPCSK